MVTPRSSLLRESVRIDGGVLWSSKKFQTRGELRNSREEQVFDNDCRDAMRAGTSAGRVCVWCAAVRTVHGCGVCVQYLGKLSRATLGQLQPWQASFTRVVVTGPFINFLLHNHSINIK